MPLILSIGSEQGMTSIILNETPFYAEGGGQPGDSGVIRGQNGMLQVKTTRRIKGTIAHLGMLEGTLEPGDKVEAQYNESERLQNSRCHSAGHIIFAALYETRPELKPTRGVHGKTAFVEYEGEVGVTDEERTALESKIAEYNKENRAIEIREVSFQELSAICPFVPKQPPKGDKPWTIMQIQGMVPIPCGGTHVKTTKEIGIVKIPRIAIEDGRTRIYYTIC